VIRQALATPEIKTHPRVPGELGIWMFVAGDLLMFGLIFLIYAFYREQEPALFIAGAASRSMTLGLVNTLLLLSGSWCVAQAMQTSWRGDNRLAVRLVAAGIATGFAFIAIKIAEWGEAFAAAKTPLSDDYYMYYFMLTGIHLLHVIAGIAALVFVLEQFRRFQLEKPNAAKREVVEACGVFWHVVDLLWIVLFALLYLLR
jgi:nitric oxide reductase NorE protein